MTFDYLVTTRSEIIPQDRQVIMVDGTVPDYNFKVNDLHFDHHRPYGADVQIDEIVWPGYNECVNESVENNAVFVTTTVDADACVAACYCQIAHTITRSAYRKLRAIAFDCDHLSVPSELSDLSDFAAQAVAAMKVNSDKLLVELGLPVNRKTWTIEDKERFASLAFKQGTEHLVNACNGVSKFPGENGEAENYWKELEEDTQRLENENRVTYYRDCTIVNMRGLQGKYIDPRCAYRVVNKQGCPKYPITITQREVFINDEFKGYSYTLAVVPLHPLNDQIDYTELVYAALSEAEQNNDSVKKDPWGGRKTVGGSGCNSYIDNIKQPGYSTLTPEQVIDVVLNTIEFEN